MKRNIFIVFCACLLIFIAVNASAVTLLIETTDSSGNEKTTFAPGEELWVNILVDVQTDVAGAAFTLLYPDAQLNPPATDTGGVSADISSPFDFFSFDDGTVLNDTHRANSTTTAGSIMFSGAAIDQTNGGGRTATPLNPIFRAKFMVDAAATPATYSLTLSETTLNNSAAGWNGEQSPVLVGALPSSDANYGGDLNDDFPVLLSSFSSPVETQFTLADSACLNGDYNGDGQLTVFDALDTYYYSVGSSTTDPVCNVEVDGTSPITVFDALQIYQCSLGQDTCN